MPPEWMWPHNDPLNQWFADVQTRRDQQYGTGSMNDDFEDKTTPLMQNSLTAGFHRK